MSPISSAALRTTRGIRFAVSDIPDAQGFHAGISSSNGAYSVNSSLGNTPMHTLCSTQNTLEEDDFVFFIIHPAPLEEDLCHHTRSCLRIPNILLQEICRKVRRNSQAILCITVLPLS
uniref:Uncharacterized protein n=1 Tax=Photinus pyralis TaxID=7054 RepID=A0A1Y1K8T3_PHOPY